MWSKFLQLFEIVDVARIFLERLTKLFKKVVHFVLNPKVLNFFSNKVNNKVGLVTVFIKGQ